MVVVVVVALKEEILELGVVVVVVLCKFVLDNQAVTVTESSWNNMNNNKDRK